VFRHGSVNLQARAQARERLCRPSCSSYSYAVFLLLVSCHVLSLSFGCVPLTVNFAQTVVVVGAFDQHERMARANYRHLVETNKDAPLAR
jgi:hypothetical protein